MFPRKHTKLLLLKKSRVPSDRLRVYPTSQCIVRCRDHGLCHTLHTSSGKCDLRGTCSWIFQGTISLFHLCDAVRHKRVLQVTTIAVGVHACLVEPMFCTRGAIIRMLPDMSIPHLHVHVHTVPNFLSYIYGARLSAPKIIYVEEKSILNNINKSITLWLWIFILL